MDKKREEQLLRWAIRLLIVVLITVVVLKLVMGTSVTGVPALLFFIFWIAQWRLFYIRGLFPGKIYTFIYSLVAVLSLLIAFRQFAGISA